MTDQHGPQSDHPTESELADLVLGHLDDSRASAVSGHLNACLPCQILFDRLRTGLPELPDGDLPDDVGAITEAALAAIVGADWPQAGPQPGELWRARTGGGGPVTLVWLRALHPHGAAAVVPVSFDSELADENTLLVPAASSPLGIPLALHESLETTIGTGALLDRLGTIDVHGSSVGPIVVTPFDERLEYRAALEDQMAELGRGALDDDPGGGGEGDDWWLVDTPSERASLLMAIHHVLGETHPRARVSPRPPAAAASEHLTALALVSELDAFVLVASIDHPLEAPALLESARRALHADQLLNAVCLVEPDAPFPSIVVDRRDVVEAIEIPSGDLRPPRQSRPPAPIGEAITKFLDTTISPFGRLASTVVAGEPIDSCDLAVDVSAEAVRAVEASARGFKVEGKRPGYERVTRHQASITRLVEAALGDPDVDVASILEDSE